MSGYEVYQIYLALKLHFTTDNYNYFTFNGKTRSNLASFEKRKDRYFFKKLATRFDHDELIQYFVSHFVANEGTWIGDISRIQNPPIYTEWIEKIQNMSFVFTSDIEKLLEENNFESIFEVSSGHPMLLKRYLANDISLETLVILNKLVRFVPDFDKKITDPIVWPEIRKKIIKYDPFLPIDTTKYKQILLIRAQTK